MDQGPHRTFDESFNAWFAGARPRLLRLALSRVRDRALAEDVVQDTALALWRRLAKGGVRDLDSYADRAVWINSIRGASRRRVDLPLDGAGEGDMPAVPPEVEEWLEAAEWEEALAGLPLPQAAALRLRFYADMTYAEMARNLSVGLNTAASRTRYALTALRKILSARDAPPAGRRPRAAPKGDPLEERHADQRRSRTPRAGAQPRRGPGRPL